MLNRLLMTALIAGVAAGILGWALQMALTTPIIVAAEVFEGAGATIDNHDDGEAADHGHGEAWAPEDGFQRHAFTLLTSVLFGVGFGAMLAAVFAFAGGDRVGWRRGLVWGLLAYAALYAAPSLGLPPEVPGMAAADLSDRQAWWLMAAVSTGIGLALIIKGNSVAVRLAGVVAIVVPHVIGAPHPTEFSGGPPAELAAKFAVASLIAVALFWMALGATAGWAFDRFARE